MPKTSNLTRGILSKAKRNWWIWFLMSLWTVVEDRIAGIANRWIDSQAQKALSAPAQKFIAGLQMIMSSQWDFTLLLFTVVILFLLIHWYFFEYRRPGVVTSTIPEVGINVGDSMSPCPDRAIHALVDRDLRHISDLVFNISRQMSKSSGALSYPWVKFHFTVYNASVHPVMISSEVKGFISCLNERIPYAPQLEIDSTYVPHGSEIKAVITQTLGKEMVEKLNRECPVGSTVDFNLGELNIPLLVQGKSNPVGHWKLGSYTLKIDTKF